jgi:hypothetical protein
MMNRLFPETVARLVELNDMCDLCAKLKMEYGYLGLTNFCITGMTIAATHNIVASAFNARRYWWMPSMKMLPYQGRK